jgi:hypothetical protein
MSLHQFDVDGKIFGSRKEAVLSFAKGKEITVGTILEISEKTKLSKYYVKQILKSPKNEKASFTTLPFKTPSQMKKDLAHKIAEELTKEEEKIIRKVLRKLK